MFVFVCVGQRERERACACADRFMGQKRRWEEMFEEGERGKREREGRDKGVLYTYIWV